MDVFEEIKSIVTHGLGKRILRSSLVYALGRRLISAMRPGFTLDAVGELAEFALDGVGRSFSRREPVAWCSAFAPVELLYALGIVPFSPEAASAVLASLGLADFFLREAESRGYSRDECSFHRAAMGACLAGYLPRPDALLCSAHPCDGATKLFRNAQVFYTGQGGNAPLFYLVDTPWGDRSRSEGGPALEYLASRIERVYLELAQHCGVKPDPGRLREAISLSNEARRWALRVNELKARVPCPLTASEVINFIYVLFIGFGSLEAVEIFKSLYNEASARVALMGSPRDSGEPARGRGREEIWTKPERYRLLWLHLKPFYPTRLWQHLEADLGAKIVFDEFSQIYWDEMDPNRPFESLARKALSHFAYGFIERRVDAILGLVRDYRPDGVIHFSHWGCRQSCGGVRILKDALAQAGVPMLALDGDCIDSRSYSEGQAMTRIEGFLEMLEQRSECAAPDPELSSGRLSLGV